MPCRIQDGGVMEINEKCLCSDCDNEKCGCPVIYVDGHCKNCITADCIVTVCNGWVKNAPYRTTKTVLDRE